MQAGDKAGWTVSKVSGTAGVITLFDQNGFQGQHSPTNHLTMNRIEGPALPSIADQDHEPPGWREQSSQSLEACLNAIEIIRDCPGCRQVGWIFAVPEPRPIRRMPDHQIEQSSWEWS